jgi:TolB-like protein
MSKSFKFLVGLLFIMVVSSAFAEEVVADSNVGADMSQQVPIAGDYLEPVNIIETNIEDTITSLATQLVENKRTEVDKTVVMTSFVRLDNLHATSEFGRVLGESLIHELSVRGFKMSEFRGQAAVSINSKGEYFITRKVKDIQAETEDAHIIIGTYSRQFKKVMINARLIDNRTGAIISTARVTFAHGQKNDCLIFNDCIKPKAMNIISQ